jgi:uncharacterized protein
MGRVVVAYSGGVDSTYLLKAATETLGLENALGVTAESPSLPASELRMARRIAAEHGFNHLVIQTHEIDDPNYTSNPQDRCYFCKSELYTTLVPLARARGFAKVASGAIADDLGDWRPGLTAAAENDVVHPLAEAGMTKEDVRALAREAGLENWDKPAAACLSSRFPYGTEITPARLRMVEQAEDFLHEEIGLRQVRVRWESESARIECASEEMPAVFTHREAICARLAGLGFRNISLDLRGYRQGALNEGLVQIQSASK